MSESPKVLVVDDELAIRKVVAMRCKQAGYVPQLAVDGADAWEQASSNSFHLIITDHQMPNMNGIDLCKVLRADDRHQSTPILMLTAMADELDTESLRHQLGIIVLQKPGGMTGLADVIKTNAQEPAA